MASDGKRRGKGKPRIERRLRVQVLVEPAVHAAIASTASREGVSVSQVARRLLLAGMQRAAA